VYLYRVSREPIPLPDRAVIFDYGEVISVTPTQADRAVIEDLAGVTPDRKPKFWDSYFTHRGPLDQGMPAREYWRAIATDMGAEWDDARVHELWTADFRSWISINPGTIEVIADLKAGGTRLAVLSNAGPDYGSYLRCGPLSYFFEAFFVSGELDMIKPDPAIFTHVLKELGVTAAEAVFIDNRAENVRGAESLGITGHVFTSPPELRSFLTGLAQAPWEER
jgi:putative hydrolase of the HAD superfamily